MKNPSVEVLVYVQELKKFLLTNEQGQKYFFLDDPYLNELFFEKVSEKSEEKFEQHGEPQLTTLEFDAIRTQLSLMSGKKETHIENKGFLGFSMN